MHCRYKRQISYLKSYLAYRVTSALLPKPKMALFARDSFSLLSMSKISLKGKPSVNNQSVNAYPDIHYVQHCKVMSDRGVFGLDHFSFHFVQDKFF